MARMKTGPKFALIFISFVAIALGAMFFAKIGPFGDQAATPVVAETSQERAASQAPAHKPQPVKAMPVQNGNERVIKLGVVTWGGYAAGQYWNKGFKANTESNFYKDYGFKVEFIVMDDFLQSREAWKAGAVDLMWITADAFPTEAGALAAYEPKIIFQADWSRGGDAIVGSRNVRNINDLPGKKVAVAFGTPSHTFLIKALEAAGVSYDSIKVIEAPSAIDAAEMFKAGVVDAAVVWAPDDAACVEAVAGAKKLVTTKEATHIIADVFYAKQSYIDANADILAQLVEGWMKGAAKLNTSETAVREAAKILERGLNQPYDFCIDAIKNVRLATAGDNRQFFGLDRSYKGVTGQDLYTQMSRDFTSLGYVSGKVPYWRQVSDPQFIRDLTLSGPGFDAEQAVAFAKASSQEENAVAFAEKRLSITFPVGGSTLEPNAMALIDAQFVPTAKMFPTSRIRIEGNTDSTGTKKTNMRLSYKRAAAVAQYLVDVHGFDPNRLVVKGNGPSKPIADNGSAAGRAQNRRTEFQLLK